MYLFLYNCLIFLYLNLIFCYDTVFRRRKLKLETLGIHILIEFYNCDEEILKNPTLIKEHMNEAAKIANATIV